MGEVSIYISKTSPLGRKLSYRLSNNNKNSLAYDEYKIEGEVKLINTDGDISEWSFDLPSGRRHNIHLKEGIEYSRL